MDKMNKTGVYESIYGNAVEYHKGKKSGYDLDMGERIPVDMIDFTKWIREID